MALRPISFRWPEEFVARIDAARGDIPRARFVRKAVERALTVDDDAEVAGIGARMAGAARAPVADERLTCPISASPDQLPSPPAEQPRRIPIPGPNVENIRSSAQAKAAVRPFPKGKR